MAGLVPAIHALPLGKDVDARHIGERSDAVLRTSMAGHDSGGIGFPDMSRIAYVNGRYRPHRDATVHIEDRGYQFSDGVYEVCGASTAGPAIFCLRGGRITMACR